MRESKECEECGGLYFRPKEYTHSQWESRRYCSQQCAGKGLKRQRETQKESDRNQGAVGAQPIDRPEEAPAERLELSERTDTASETRVPITRDLRIVRVGQNPRLVG
jgi:hypothetical protein